MSARRTSVTAREVAEKAGVAVSTVGRALADDPRVSQLTKDRVRDAAAQLNYAGNLPARMMRGGESNLVGLIIPDLRNPFYATVMQVLNATANRFGYRLVLSVTDDDSDTEARHVRDLVGARVSGVIIVPTASPTPESVRLLTTVPHVQLLRRNAAFADRWFGIDDEVALRTATEHVIGLGHRRIAYIGGDTGISTAAARLRGFRGALAAARGSVDGIEHIGPPSIAFGGATLRHLLACDTPPTAIIAGADAITLGMIEVIEQLGVAVPGDVSIVGFGDATWLSWWHGGLTTVHVKPEELATECGDWFFDGLRNRQLVPGPGECQSVTVQTALVVRRTTAPRSKLE